MRAVIQRVKHASVKIDNEIIGKIDKGYLILLGICHEDTKKELEWLAKKIKDLRIFEDEDERMNLSLEDVNGEVLVVSQFTLYANCIKGRRPSFIKAARPDLAEKLYLDFVDIFKSFGIKTETGSFGADMKVELLNDGPVTIIIDTDDLK